MSAADDVRRLVYTITAESGRPPLAAELARRLETTRDEILERFRQLNASRLLALAPDSGEIVMAPPFSAVPTPFANCVWDAYGIPAALRRDAEVSAACGCCGEPMRMAVANGEPVATGGVAHFAVPAAHWWDDLVYT